MFGEGELMAYELKDYVEVPDRIRAWHEKHREGRIVCEIVTYTDALVVVKASVYRTSDSLEAPAGVGHSSLTIPGKTPYTRDSELENAETSAAGRALVMAGIPAKSVSSAQEVQSKRGADRTSAPARPARRPSPPSSGGAERVESGGESVAFGEGATGNNAPGSTRTDCKHKYWADIPDKPGWMKCEDCGSEGTSS